MVTCKGCGLDTVDPRDEARYDVLNPAFDPENSDISDFGPYDATCFAETVTGKQQAGGGS